MYYVCIEDDKIISILNYEPNVPETVTVCEISDDDYELLNEGTHYFSIGDMSVLLLPEEKLELKKLEETKNEYKAKLSSTDWKVMRHIREKALNMPTTLTDEEYIELETLRQSWADFINK